MTQIRPVRRALLAVYDKTGIVEMARGLTELDVSLVSSGGTAAALREAGLAVTPVEEVTGSPEMLDGRVKTLHPRIHAGLLADRRNPEHEAQLAEHGIEPFDLVVVNLYPFRDTVASGAAVDDVIEKIDIGGPAMVRAAAKNFESVGVVVDPSGYATLLSELRGSTRASWPIAANRSTRPSSSSTGSSPSTWSSSTCTPSGTRSRRARASTT